MFPSSLGLCGSDFQAEPAFWRPCCSSVVVRAVGRSAAPATAAVSAAAKIPATAALRSPISLLECCGSFLITFKRACVSEEPSQGLV